MHERRIDRLFSRFCRARDLAALAAVFDATAPELLRVARHTCRHAADAEDIVQQTFLAAIESRARYRHGEPVLPWLVGILANHVRMLQRERARAARHQAREDRNACDPALAAEHGELHEEVERALARLPEPYGPVLSLYLRFGLTAEEISASLRRPPGTVRSQITRGLEQLRKALPAGLATATAVMASAAHGLGAVRANVLGRARDVIAAGVSFAAVPSPAMSNLVLLLAGGVVLTGGALWWLRPGATAAGATVQAAASSPQESEPASPSGGESASTRVPVLPVAALRLVRGDGGNLLVATATEAQSSPPPSTRVRAASGQVLDEAGLPVAGAEIWLPPRVAVEPLGRVTRHREQPAGHSDAAGRFTIEVEGDGTLVAARKRGYGASFSAWSTKESGDTRLVLRRGCGSIAGRVRDGAGAPVAGVEVALCVPEERPHRAADGRLLAPFIPLVARSDGRGAFTIDGAPIGGWGLVANAPGWLPCEQPVLVTSGEAIAADLRMVRKATLRGSLRDPDGPVAAVTVSLMSLVTLQWVGTAKTATDGTFALEATALGPCRVHANVPCRGRAQQQIVLEEGQQANCELVLARLPSLHGRLEDPGGAPLADWRVRVFESSLPRRVHAQEMPLFEAKEAITDTAGAFTVEDLEPKHYSLQIECPSHLPLLGPVVREQVLPSNVPLCIRMTAEQLAGASLTARFLRPDGVEAAELDVHLARRDVPMAALAASGRTDARGRLRIAGLAPGPYAVSAAGVKSRVVDLAAGQTLDLGDVCAEERATLHLVLTDAAGAPWRGDVPALWLNSVARGGYSTHTGKGLSLKLPAGSYRIDPPSDLVASPCTVEVRAGETRTVDVALMLGTTRTVRFRGAAESRSRWLDLKVCDANGRLLRECRQGRPPASSEGLVPHFTCMLPVVPGAYVLEASTDDGLRWRHVLEVLDTTPDDRIVEVAPLPR